MSEEWPKNFLFVLRMATTSINFVNINITIRSFTKRNIDDT